MSNKRKAAAILLLLDTLYEEKQRKKPKYWVKPWFAKRSEQGCHENLLKELLLEDQTSFRRYLRMDEDTYKNLLSKVTPLIEKKDTNFRLAITPSEKLAITLRFLATGESQWSLSTQFRVGQSTICKFLVPVCLAIFNALKEEYLKLPSTPQEWKCEADNFNKMWNFPHCVGAVDGKHVAIKSPPKSGSVYYNYKGFYSIVLMAVVNSDLTFSFVDAGTPGRMSDGGTWDKCLLNKMLTENKLNIPAHDSIFGCTEPLPFVFVGDEAFPLKENMLRPYPGTCLESDKRIFNYRLSRARRISENAFGVLANTWRILHTTIDMEPKRVEILLLAICNLQNYLMRRKKTRSIIAPPGLIDAEDQISGDVILGDWRNDQNNALPSLERLRPQGSTKNAGKIRDEFKNYFNGFGSVPWQNKVFH